MLVFICVLGGVSGILWSILGCRESKAVRAFMDMAGDLEKEVIRWPIQLVKYKPATLSNGLRDSPSSRLGGSRVVVVYGPLVLTGFYKERVVSV